jgi:caffeoyl-CoA O-methyltransferase
MPATRPDVVAPDIARYVADHSTPPDAVQHALMAATEERTGAHYRMQIGGDQGLLMEMVARAMGARQVVEIGTFTGYSALCLARGVGPDGHVLCCDVSEEWTTIAREHWAAAGLSDRIELRIGPALDTLRALPTEPRFDLAFIDADKTNYTHYFDEIVPRLRAGGLILVDNTLWSGRVIDSSADDADTVALRAFNAKVVADDRVSAVIVPIGDGLTFLQKH